MLDLLGESDRHLRQVEDHFPDVRFVARGDEVALKGPDTEVERARTVLEELLILVQEGHALDSARVDEVVKMVIEDVPSPSGVLTDGIPVGRGRMIRPKTHGQQKYMEAIRENTLTFGIGPAGTGKTYLAMAAAVDSLVSGSVRRIILTRPAVEAGERLGFLPGDLMAKVDPYLRPLYDALYDMVEPEGAQRLLERQTVEVAPLAFMRGRTLNNSFIILDEAQNTTPEQMKMFLTRIGFGSKAVVTGDVTQIDVPGGRSGLVGLDRVLAGIDGLDFVWLTGADVIRHRIVAEIVAAYERAGPDGSEPGTGGNRRG
jgi:phosphate starvation-inducible PhoH-like protein